MSEPRSSSTARFVVPALDCAEELALIEAGLKDVRGILRISPNFLERSLTVEFTDGEIDRATIVSHLQRIGFPAREPTVRPSHLPVVSATEPADDFQRPFPPMTMMGGGFLLAGIASQFLASESMWLPLLSVASTILSAWPVAWAAWRAVRLWRLDMNALMMVAAVGALASAPVTREWLEAPTAMFLFGISLWLENLSLGRARRAVRTLVALSPSVAHRITEHTHGHHHDHRHPGKECSAKSETTEEETTDVSPDTLSVGDLVLVRPGERIPVDGEVVAGESSVNEAPITGESLPVEKNVGSSLFAGSLNGEGALRICVTRAAEESTLAHIGRLVEQAHATRAPTERFIDTFARRYTPLVIIAALLLAFVPPTLAWLHIGWNEPMASAEFFQWLHRGLVLLVIACPCALVISTPITIVCGLRRAANLGLLIKGGAYLEALGQIRSLAIDKTGTLTDSRPRVSSVQPVNGVSEEEVLSIAASLEAFSEHPLATAIVAATRDRNIRTRGVIDFQVHRGAGVQGQIDGVTYLVATPKYFLSQTAPGKQLSPDITANVWVGTAERILGTIRFDDQPRPDAAKTIRELHALQVAPIVMLTGDSVTAARRIAGLVGVDEFQAPLLPTEKVEHVRKLAQHGGQFAMVGDGVNDAPALAAAGVGIAFGLHASDTALETADVIILSPHLTRVPQLIRLGRQTRRLLSQNIILAIAIKVLVMLLAAGGLATLWMAVLADVGASLLVIFNGMRLLKCDVEPK